MDLQVTNPHVGSTRKSRNPLQMALSLGRPKHPRSRPTPGCVLYAPGCVTLALRVLSEGPESLPPGASPKRVSVVIRHRRKRHCRCELEIPDSKGEVTGFRSVQLCAFRTSASGDGCQVFLERSTISASLLCPFLVIYPPTPGVKKVLEENRCK